jgi:DnaK suppressor protein
MPLPQCERASYVTSTVHDPIDLLRNTLEQQLKRRTNHLHELTVHSEQPNRAGYDDGTLAALLATARQAVDDTARALRRIADGTYGSCERCTAGIPVQRLQILPHARFCVQCQQALTG